MKLEFDECRILLDNKSIYLTNIENIILKLLFNNKGKVVKYEEIALKIYNLNIDAGLKSTIRKHISLLRKKIGKNIEIKTIREVGYIIEEDLK